MTSIDRVNTVNHIVDDGPRDPREPIHELNGHLLEALQKLIPAATMRWNEWIINVIMLHRNVVAEETVTLKTSATLYLGEKFFSQDDCRTRGLGKVETLDGDVPMNDSYAGYCVREGGIVWEDDLGSTRRPSSSEADVRVIAAKPHPLEDKYRSFDFVGVKTEGPARSEYVFPIRLRIGLSAAMLGVLNCEWYGPPHTENAFQKIRRSRIAHLITHLLDVHGRFLPLAFDRARAPGGNWSVFLKTYYDPCMELHVARIRKGAPE